MHEHAVGERHATQTNGAAHDAERSLSACLQPRRGRPGTAVADRRAVDRDDRHHLADRRRQERLVGAEQVGERRTRLRAQRLDREHERARDARQHARPHGRREQRRRRAATRRSPSRASSTRPRATSSASSAPALFRLAAGGERDVVARRLRAGEQRRWARPTSKVFSARPRARSSSRPAGSARSGRDDAPARCGRAAARGRAAPRRATSVDELLDAVGLRQRERRGGEAEARQVVGEQERPAAVDADRLERGAAAKQRVVVGAEDRLARIDEPAAGDRDGEQRRHAGTRPPTAASSGRALTHDSSISASGSESQTMPPPTQRWIHPSAIANVRIVRASSKSPFAADASERAHRRAAADRLEARDLVDRGDLRRAGDRAAGERRVQDLGEPGVRPQTPLDRRDEVRDAGELALAHQLRPADGAGLADARRGRCARGRRSSRARRRPWRRRRPRRAGACP